jgi:hypothetical protein
VLRQHFAKPEDVTRACLTCHTEASAQFHKTIHWTWIDPNAEPAERMGKGGLVVNNFCISILSNEPRCTSCHAGYGWKDKDFDFTIRPRWTVWFATTPRAPTRSSPPRRATR